jgi:cell division protein FtsB
MRFAAGSMADADRPLFCGLNQFHIAFALVLSHQMRYSHFTMIDRGVEREAGGPADVATLELPPIPRRGERRRKRLDLILTFVATILLVNALVGDRGLMETWRARRNYSALVNGISSLRVENQTLRDHARRLREDPDAIESLARQELGLIRPGEILVVVRTSGTTR